MVFNYFFRRYSVCYTASITCRRFASFKKSDLSTATTINWKGTKGNGLFRIGNGNWRIIPEGYTSSIPKALKFLIMSCIVSYRSNRYLLGVGLQKVYCQFGLLLSSFFLLDRFIPNFGNLLNLISLSITGYFRSYLFKFFLFIFFRNPHV